jgi:hypothetical protein
MLKMNSAESNQLEISNSNVTKIGCYYIVSIKQGGRKITSFPQHSIEAAITEFRVRYALATL